MKLLINCTNKLGGGGAQVATSFIYECRDFTDNEYIVVLGKNDTNNNIVRSEFPKNFVFIDIGATHWLKLHSKLARIENEYTPDVVFTVFGPAYWRPKAKHLVGFAQGYYIYPESPFWAENSLSSNLKIWLKKKLHLSYFKNDSDALICETKDASDRLEKVLNCKNKKYYYVSNTCGSYFIEKNSCNNKLHTRNDNEFRLLTISKFYLHKNIHTIPKVIDKLLEIGEKNIRFVITIEPNIYNTIFDNKYKEYIINIGPILNRECPSLYDECDATYLPTTMECFTASYPESMIMNKPILTSDLPFAHTICEDAALYFNPKDYLDIAKNIVELKNNSNLRSKLIRNGLDVFAKLPTAKQRAEQYLKICKQLL